MLVLERNTKKLSLDRNTLYHITEFEKIQQK